MAKLRAIHILSLVIILIIFAASTALVFASGYGIFTASLFSFMNIIGATFPPNSNLLDQRNPLVLGSVALGMIGNIAFTITFTTIFYQVLSEIDVRYFLTKQKLKVLSKHVIITPVNSIGIHFAKKLRENKISTVFVDENMSMVRKAAHEGMLAVHGDPARAEVLEEARISDAHAFYILFDDDVKNTFVTIEGNRLNKKLRIVTKVKNLDDIPKMERSGARRIIIPEAAVGIEIGDFLLVNT